MSPLLRDSARSDANASRRLILILALFFFIIALSLIIIQSLSGSPKLIRSYADGYADGFKKARAMAEQRMPNIGQSVRVLTGKVASVGNDSITVNAENVYVDEAVDGVGMVRTIVIGSDTKIIQIQPLSQEEIRQASMDFQNKMKAYDPKSGTPPPAPNLSGKESPLTLKDLKPGDRVVITPQADVSDVSLLGSFTAATISVSR